MRYPSFKLVLLAAVLLLGATARSQSVFTVTIQQSGSDVVAVGSGNFDSADLTEFGVGNISYTEVDPADGQVTMGTNGPCVSFLGTFTGPANFGPGGFTLSYAGYNGTSLSVQTAGNGNFYLYIATGYVSGTAVASSALFSGETLNSLGLTPGVYTDTYAAGGGIYNVDVLAPTPEPGTLALSAFGGLALLGLRRRQA